MMRMMMNCACSYLWGGNFPNNKQHMIWRRAGKEKRRACSSKRTADFSSSNRESQAAKYWARAAKFYGNFSLSHLFLRQFSVPALTYFFSSCYSGQKAAQTHIIAIERTLLAEQGKKKRRRRRGGKGSEGSFLLKGQWRRKCKLCLQFTKKWRSVEESDNEGKN